MRCRAPLAALPVLVLLGAWAGPSPGLALPPATPSSNLGVPRPEECREAPRTPAELRGLIATPLAGGPTPTPVPYGTTVAFPDSEPVAPDTLAAVVATQREALACYNADDGLRTLALYSDGFVRRIVRDNTARGVNLRRLYDQLTPARRRRRSDWRGIVDVRDGRLLPDGRVVAVFEVSVEPGPGATETDLVWFAFERGRWRIDEFAPIDITIPDPATPGPPTPGGGPTGASRARSR